MPKKLISFYLLFTMLFLVICVRTTNPNSTFSSKTVTSESLAVPVLMYHGITTKPSQINDYFIYQSTFENDLKYLKENGYHTVTPRNLVAYINGKFQMPEKPVMITFDDGYCNNYNLAYPLLKKYNAKVLVSVIGSASQNASDATYRSEDYCNMTWDQIEEISDSGYFEIGNHTWDLHSITASRKGAAPMKGENKADYQKMLKLDLSKVQDIVKEKTGKEPVAFAWPYGFNSDLAKPVFDALGIKVTFTSRKGISTIKKGDPSSLFNLKRLLRTPNASISKLLETD